MFELQELLDQSAAMHHHLCPRQVLGVRMGLFAGDMLGLNLPQSNKRLYTFMETDGCAADGVSVASGCWVGRRTMRIMDFGKVAATFVDTRTGEALRICPRAKARRLAVELCPEARSRWHAQLEAYQVISNNNLFTATSVVLQVDLKAILSRSGVRAACEICGEEIINERDVEIEGSTLCRACAGEAYYAAIKQEAFVAS